MSRAVCLALLLTGCSSPKLTFPCGNKAIVRCSGTGTPADAPGGLRDRCVRVYRDSPVIKTSKYALPVSRCSVEYLP